MFFPGDKLCLLSRQVVGCNLPRDSKLFKCVRKSVTSAKNSKSGLEPVKLSYSSYESTEPLVANSPPIIILHGVLGSKNNWNSLSKILFNKTQRKIVAIDARNHGASPFSDEMSYPHMTEDLRLLTEDLEIKKTSLIGHSMGGRTAINFALRYPTTVESLVVLDISPYGRGSAFQNVLDNIIAMQAVKLEPKLPLSKARILADKQLMTDIPDLQVRQFILTALIQDEDGTYKWKVNLEVLRKTLPEQLIKFPLDESLRFHGPVLFIVGKQSDFVQAEHIPGIKKLFPKAEFEYMDCGHWPHAEKPQEFLAIVSKFFQAVDQKR